jgi:hypothetical protein
MNHPKDIQTKAEAVSYVEGVLRASCELFSITFQFAMDLSRRFDISAQDVLQHRKDLTSKT